MNEYDVCMATNESTSRDKHMKMIFYSEGKISSEESARLTELQDLYPARSNFYFGQRNLRKQFEDIRDNTESSGLIRAMNKNLEILKEDSKDVRKAILMDTAEIGLLTLFYPLIVLADMKVSDFRYKLCYNHQLTST